MTLSNKVLEKWLPGGEVRLDMPWTNLPSVVQYAIHFKAWTRQEACAFYYIPVRWPWGPIELYRSVHQWTGPKYSTYILQCYVFGLRGRRRMEFFGWIMAL